MCKLTIEYYNCDNGYSGEFTCVWRETEEYCEFYPDCGHRQRDVDYEQGGYQIIQSHAATEAGQCPLHPTERGR